MPTLINRISSRLSESDHYTLLASSRVRSTEMALNDVAGKIRLAQHILGEGPASGAPVPISSEQRQVLLLGVDQLHSEKERLEVHLEILRTNEAAVSRGDYFYEQSALGAYDSAIRSDPAPYVTEILADVAANARMTPREPERIKKFLAIARSRVEQAAHELRSVRVQRQALERILSRASSEDRDGSLPFNAIEMIRRDASLLQSQEAYWRSAIELLRSNVTAVESGDLTFETNLLERFNPNPTPVNINSTQLISR